MEQLQYLGVDYARPGVVDLAAMKAQGYSFAVRYLTPPGWWNLLTPEEARAIAAAGFPLVSVWETSAGAPVRGGNVPSGVAFFTPERGAREGAQAVRTAAAVGQPLGTPIYATVDYDMAEDEWPAVDAYLGAFQQALGSSYLLGVYGSWLVIEKARALTPWLWQTYAWSGGRLHPAARLYQFRNTTTFDHDRAFGNPGWWWPPGATPVEPTPAPPMEKGGIGVPLTKRGDQGNQVAILQLLLNVAGYGPVAVDGDFGLETYGAVKAFQRGAGLADDGIVGPLTWGALAKITPTAASNQQELNDMATQIQNLTNALGDANAKLAQVRSIVGA